MNRTAAKIATAGLALASIVSLAGCGGGSSKASATTFPNPVDIIKKINACTLEPGVTQGDVGMDGTFKTASCTSQYQTGISVDTFKDAAGKAADLARNPPGDGRAIISGDNYLVFLTAPVSLSGGGYDFNPVPENVRYTLGGTLVQ